jgi:uncharacterized OsmC-like protein
LTFSVEAGPLAFKLRPGRRRLRLADGAPAREIFKVDARHVGGHVREAVVSAGDDGSAWRMLSDEGLHLRGSDLAPFPFGYFNAGLQGDLMRCLRNAAAARGVALDALDITLDNEYWLTGSFAAGTGQGHAEPTRIEIRLQSAAPASTIAAIVAAAIATSPALALLRTPLTNTFALYINGRRRKIDGVAASPAADVEDPFLRYAAAPQPLAGGNPIDAIEKIATREAGEVSLAPSATTTRITRKVAGRGRLVDASGLTEIETWLQLPGMSHFVFRSDEGTDDRAPSGLALLSTGLAFCYMTQLARYVESMKLAVGSIRLVQFSPYANGVAEAVDTHLFLNGEAPEAVQANLLSIAARTCYLHATVAATLPPVVHTVHNGAALR